MRFESCYKWKLESGFMTLKIELLHTDIKRTVVLPDNISLANLSNLVDAIIGWNGCYPWKFEKDGVVVCSANMALASATGQVSTMTAKKISSLLTKRGDKITYTYNPDERWTHRITRMADTKYTSPVCLKTRGTMCIEDLGGALGFLDFLGDLKYYDKNPKRRPKGDFMDILKWSGFGKRKLRKEFLLGPTCDDITKLLEKSLGM